MPEYPAFTIQFEDGQTARATAIPPKADAHSVVQALELAVPRPVLFISGGAGNMSAEDMEATTHVIQDAVALFAEQNRVVVIDGGTDAGVMQMIGEARHRRGFKFPLVGVAPLSRVQYPTHVNAKSEAYLQSGHSHFVLLKRGSWGHESQTIIDLTRAISGGAYPMLGILINGGKIAQQDIYLATTPGEHQIPVLVLDGSGRKADEVSNALKTGTTSSRVIRAIIAGGAIDLVSLKGGAAAMLAKLQQHFEAKTP